MQTSNAPSTRLSWKLPWAVRSAPKAPLIASLAVLNARFWIATGVANRSIAKPNVQMSPGTFVIWKLATAEKLPSTVRQTAPPA